MFTRPFDVIAIGDITIDAFLRITDASVQCDIDNEHCQICMKFGDKIAFDGVEEICGVGNSPNASVSIARLGLRAALVSIVGRDHNGKRCIATIRENNVSVSYINTLRGKKTNYHYVLWYEAERTILVHHQDYKYSLPRLPEAKWVYLSSLSSSSEAFHTEIAAWLQKHPEVKLCFQPGTFQMKLGIEKMRLFYEQSEVFIVNVEEAQRILDLPNEKDKKVLMKKLSEFGPKIVCVTDGPKGAYMYDTRSASGSGFYFMPIYPDPKPPYERTGCGDAFASTFVTALSIGKTALEALTWAPINPMSVVQYAGAQKGLLKREELETLLKNAPADYKPREI